MVSHRSRQEQPDEDRDVIVSPIQVLDAKTGWKRDTWTVWLGREKQGEYTTVEEAAERARQLARMHCRRVWLQEANGYPLKPIEC